jgi:hypothetical protein
MDILSIKSQSDIGGTAVGTAVVGTELFPGTLGWDDAGAECSTASRPGRSWHSSDKMPVHDKDMLESGFVPSDVWAIKKEMEPFVPRLNAAALASPDGHDPSSQTSAARAGTTTFHSGTVGPMSHFFTDDPKADTYDNAVDKSAWLKETCSGRWDQRPPVVASPAEAGSMCPVEYGGSHGLDLGAKKTETCAICYEDMDAESNVLALKCDHSFHLKCVLLQRGRTCGLCRATISKNVWTGSGKPAPPLVPPTDEITEEQLIADDEMEQYEMTPRDEAELAEIEQAIAQGHLPEWHLTRFWAQRRGMGRQHALHRAGYGQ